MPTNETVQFRLLREADLDLIACWLTEPGPAREFYNEIGHSHEEVIEHYRDKIEPESVTTGYVIEWDKEPIGYIQRYWIADYPEHERSVGAWPGGAGIDLFLGYEDLLGRGLGPRIVRAFLAEFIFGEMNAQRCVVDPSEVNRRSVRAFEKCGFKRVARSTSPDGRATLVMLLWREDFEHERAESSRED